MDAALKRHVRNETVIATCLCSLLPSLAVAFHYEPFPVPLRGPQGLVGFALISTLVAVSLMTLLMTLGARAKLRRGGVPALPRERLAWLALVPRPLLLRVPLLAAGAALLMAAGTAALGNAVAMAPLERPAFVAYNLVIGALIGLLMTPLIQCAALSDGAAARTLPPAQAA